MRFRKRLSAVILALVMMLPSMQVPGGTSYAAELDGGGITSGQDALILAAEETEEDTEAEGAESSAADGAKTDDDSQTSNDNPTDGDSQTGDDNPTGGDSQPGNDNPVGDGNPAGDDSQPEDRNPADDDSQPNDENVSEEETDAGQVSDDDAEEPVLSEDTEGLNAENLDCTFMTLEGRSVSSRADGKPKVLFFFDSDDYYSQQTSKTLSAHIKNFNGVDIYAIEMKFHTANEVYDFKNTYGCDEITYCYDAQSPDTYNYCYKYVDMLNISSGISRTPIIVFIDSENRVQHGTGGGRKWSEVLTDLREYCVNDYEDMGEERLNVDLVKRSFTTLDDTYVNCRTDGRPKLLVFVDVNNSDEDAGSTVQGISQSISNFAGVDIYVIDAFLNSKEDVSQFRDDYGCDDITFAYDKTDYTQSNLAYFLELAEISLDVTCPVILYVDDCSTMRWVSQGNISAEDIYENLRKYCDFSLDMEKVYKIKYVLDGGTNNESNPNTYMVGTETIVLEDASKAHFEFEGWYKDAEFEERVTQIRKGSTGNVTLYAKWTRLEDGLDLPNFDQTYSGIDGKKLSSKADGKPKLLVFFMHSSDSGKETMQNITKIIDRLSGIDVYAIDMRQSSSVSDLAKDAREYKEAYGCDEIKFSYADWYSPSNYDKGDAYQQAAGLSGMYLPLMCYIDTDNKLQWVSDHEQTSGQIIANLEKYCGYHAENPQGGYKITYVLDGGINNEDNPDTYTAETETIVLKDPSKTNCLFEGWYEDARYNKRVTEIAKGSEGNITLYAKWSKTGLDAANLNYTFTTLDEQTVSSNAEGKPKVLFFFKTDCLKCRQTNQGLRDNIEAFSGVDIYAIEINNKAKEDVAKFKEDFGCDEITYCYDKDRTYNACLWDYVENITHVDDGGYVSTPVIVLIDSENRVQYGTAGMRSWTDILTDLQEYCGYAYGNVEGIYKISYALDGGTNNEYNPDTYTAETQNIWLQDATKEGYMFDGWYKEAEFKNKVTYIAAGTTGDITLYAKWKKSAENPEYTFTTIDDETVSSRAEGKPKVLFFFKPDCQYCRNTSWSLNRYIKGFCGADIYAVEISERTKEEVVKFKEDFGCDEITYCYDKDGTYNTCFWDYVRDITHIGSGSVQTPVLVFIDSENQVQYATSGERSAFDILADLRQHCGYDYYWIDYYLAYGEDNSENPEFYKSSGDTITLKDPVREGYKFRGWYKDLEYTQKVTQIPTGTTGDITLYPKWLKKEEGLGIANLDRTFTALDDTELSSKANGRPKLLIFVSKVDEYDNVASSVVKAISQSISSFAGVDIYVIDYDLNSKEDVSKYKDAYGCDEMKFAYDTTNGTRSIIIEYLKAAGQQYLWTTPPVICYIDENDILQWISQGQISVETILDNLDIYCDYTSEGETPLPVGTYKITYILNGGTNSSENPATYTEETETITLKDAVREGYIFDGWYKDAGFKEKVTKIVNGSTGNITLYAKWKEIPTEPGTYRITYELNGGTNDSENPVIYTSDSETITLKDPVKAGFIFEGWYADARFNRKVTEIARGSTGDITLYAKWKAAPVVIDPDDQGNIQTGIYVRFTDYYRLGKDSRPCYKYTGAAVKPAVEVYNNGTLLTNGTDYTITYKNNTKVGTAALTVKGKGSFSGGSNAVSFDIINADIRLDTEHPTKMTVIAGTKVTPIIMNGDKKLTTKDYKLEGSGLVNGKYAQPTGVTPNTLTVTGIGSYEGSSFTIAVTVIDSKDARKLAVTVDKNFKPVYDGNAIDLASLFSSPTRNGSITVTDSKEKTKVLENGKDFSVICTSSLRDAGTVKFTVTGMGVYTGSVSKSFKISPLKITDNSKFNVTFDNRTYEYKASGTTVDNLKVTYLGESASAYDDKVLTPDADYKVTYANNKKVSTESKKAQVKITLLGSYKGSKPLAKDFTIGAAKLSMQTSGAQAGNTKVIIPDKVYDKAGKAYKSTPIVIVDGVSIKASNYSVSYAWTAVTYSGTEGRYEEGSNVSLEETDGYAKVKVKIALKGSNYALAGGTGSIEGEYYVRRKTEGVTDLSKAKVTFQDKDGNQLKALEYNGRAYYTPEGNSPWGSSAQSDQNAVYVSVTVDGKSVSSSLYNVVWTDATAKGKATVVVTGKGSWAVGSKNQTISIKPMALKDKIINYFKLK